MPIVVARRGGQVVGYVVSSPLDDQSDDPILDGMLQAYPGSPGSYVYGPICVAASERGKGVARAMFRGAAAQLPDARGSPSSAPTTPYRGRSTPAWACARRPTSPSTASAMSSSPMSDDAGAYGSFELIRMKAMRQGSLPRLTQA